jgi:hypothetical protein
MTRLDEFITEMEDDLRRLELHWLEQHSKTPQQFPMEDDRIEWWRKFAAFAEWPIAYPSLSARLQALEEAARVVERYQGPIETYNPGYREWMKCAAEIRALAKQPPGPKPPPRVGREVA